MSTFIDKLNLKLTTPTKTTAQPPPPSFDQTYLKIKVVSGHSQLCSIKLDCTWVEGSSSLRPPELACKWFNKTQNSMTIIEGVVGSYYQPCLADIGTIIHVQCIPQLTGSEYEGMPIIKQIGPIAIDNETEEETNDLLMVGKATFSIRIKNGKDKLQYNDGLIKIQANSLRILSRSDGQQKQLINTTITESIPIFKSIRSNPKQLEMQYTNPETHSQLDKISFQVANNKIRDILMLMVKIISIREDKQQNSDKIQEGGERISQERQERKERQLGGKQMEIREIISEKGQEEQKQMSEKENLHWKSEQQLAQQQILTKTSSNNEQQAQNSPQLSKKTQTSWQQQMEQSSNSTPTPKKNIHLTKANQIKSSEDLTSVMSPLKKKCKTVKTDPPVKQNTLDALLIADLKKQLRVNEIQIFQLKKQIKQQNQNIQQNQQQMSIIKQRQTNLSINYFQLENQLKSTKQNYNKVSQQVSYYRNQNKIIKIQTQHIINQNKTLQQQIAILEQQLKPFTQHLQHQPKIQTYQQLQHKYQQQLSYRTQLQLRYRSSQQQSTLTQQKYIQLQSQLERLQDQKHFYKKKYQKLANQLQLFSNNSNSQLTHSSIITPTLSQIKYSEISQPTIMMKSCTNLSDMGYFQQPHQISSSQLTNNYQRQLLTLKKQLQEKIQQNNFLKSIKSISDKLKQPSSKQHLKAELLEMKKLVGVLTETVTEKDLALQHLRDVNREIGGKLFQAAKKINQLERRKYMEMEEIGKRD